VACAAFEKSLMSTCISALHNCFRYDNEPINTLKIKNEIIHIHPRHCDMMADGGVCYNFEKLIELCSVENKLQKGFVV